MGGGHGSGPSSGVGIGGLLQLRLLAVDSVGHKRILLDGSASKGITTTASGRQLQGVILLDGRAAKVIPSTSPIRCGWL